MKGLEKLNVAEQTISINSRKIVFKGRIEAVAISPDKIFVVVDMPSKDKVEEQNNLIKKYNLNVEYQTYSDSDISNNAFCYDYEGNLIWQIRPPKFKGFSDHKSPIVGVDFNEKKNELHVNDFMTFRYRVDMNTGERLDFILTK